MTIIQMSRVYDDPTPGDGVRVLVDRLWPRGLHRADPRVGRWFKVVAPSTELRRWYGHLPERYAEFNRRYRAELDDPGMVASLQELLGFAGREPLTLLTATKEIEESHLPTLKAALARV